jgi:signal transduction histidine kinase
MPEPPRVLPPPQPLRLESAEQPLAAWTYPTIGFFLGGFVGVLLGHPLTMVVVSIQEYIQRLSRFDLFDKIRASFAPHMWPMMTLLGISCGVFGAALGLVFRKLKEHQWQIETLHQEFELHVASLRHHYKNLTIGIEGFSGRVNRKVTELAQQIRESHGENCPQEDCYCHNLPGLEKDVGMLADTSKRLNATLGRELSFLKALTGDLAAPLAHDLYPVLADAIRDLLEARFRDKRIQVEINGRPWEESQGPLVFSFELATMEVILENLLSNAMKFADHIQLSIADTNDTVQIAVMDNGEGFEVEELRNQLRVSRNHREAGSTQLGLRVTLHLLEKCDGRLLVSSQPGAGSNFTLEFPRKTSGNHWARREQ